MSNPVKQVIPQAEARRILGGLQIGAPEEIDLELISAMHDILVREEPMTGAEARLIRTSGGGVITVRSDLSPPGRKRFAIAHELGHYFLHPQTRQLKMCTEKDMGVWKDSYMCEEAEANAFASELLMPSLLFEPLLKGKDPGFDLIKELAGIFNTTLTAASLQFIRLTREPCLLVCSDGKTRVWYSASRSFLSDFQVRNDTPIHHYTCACDLIRNHKSREHADNVPAGAWLERYSPDGRECVTEDSILLGSYGSVLSLIWVSSEI